MSWWGILGSFPQNISGWTLTAWRDQSIKCSLDMQHPPIIPNVRIGVWNFIKPEPQEMFGGFIHRSSQGIWMSRDDLVYLSLNFVMDQLRRNQPRRRKIFEKNWPGASTIDSSIFLLVPFCGVTLERRKPPQVILDVLGEARGEQYSINLHYPLHCYSVLAGPD